MHRKWLSGGMGLGFVVFCALAIAAVPGFFQSVDSTSGYTVAGSGGSSGQVLCSDGTRFNTPCNPSGSAFYQTVTGTAGDTAQRGKLGFSANFQINDLSGFNETEIDLTASGPGTGTFACPSSVSFDSFGRMTAITAGSCGSATDKFLIITSGICSTPGTSYGQCSMGPFTWPTGGFPDSAYALTCTALNPSGSAITGLFGSSKTATTFSLILQNGTSDGAHAVTVGEIDCHGSHN